MNEPSRHGFSRRPGRRSLRLKDVIVFGSLPVLLIAYLLTGAVIDYSNARQYDDWWSRGRVAKQFLQARLATALGMPRAVAFERGFDPESPDPGLIRLRVAREAWDAVLEDPLSGWGIWVDGELMRADNSYPVELRKRGDTSVHWTTPKKSFTVKTGRGDLFRGFRRFGLSSKDVLPQYVSGTLAAEFDLMAPFVGVSPVYLNDRFYGLYRFVEGVDESFLRRLERLPGSVYRADAAERGEYFKGTDRRAFANPAIWERVTENDGPDGQDHSTFREFLDAVAGSTFTDHLRLMELLDRDEVARLMAAMLVVGDPYHMSNIHNQLWYQDPSSGTMHPIPWDLRVLDLANPPDQPLNDFLRAALRDPFVVDATLREVEAHIAGGELQRTADSVALAMWERYANYFAFEELRERSIPPVGEPEEVLSQLAANIDVLNGWINDSPVRFHAGLAKPGLLVLDFETLGYAGVDLTLLDFEVAGGGALRVVADTDLDGRPGAGDRELSGEWAEHDGGLRLVLDPVLELLPGWDTAERRVLPGNVAYRLFVTGDAESLPAPLTVRPGMVNRITGEPVEVQEWEEGTAARAGTAWSPWRFPTVTPREIRLRGDVRLTEDLRIGPAETLVIEPGTTVRLAPDVSVLSRGLVLARGLEERPIRFVPAEDGVPWGALALQGDGSDGSRFSHVEFVGGGGASDGAIDYRGMVSVHRARDVVFERVSFADNLRSDDALNAVHAEVLLRDCAFVRANLDAVDFDFSGGEIVGCRFDEAGNDAIDLMGSPVLIANNVIRDSGDKGISVGEASRPLIFNNRIEGCQRGIEIKDRSRPFILHNAITENGIGILQAVKNWRYGSGGRGKLAFTSVWNNEVDLASDPRSRLTAVESLVGGEPVPPSGAPSDGSDSWIYAHFGIEGGTAVPGLLEEWSTRPRLDPIVRLRFPETPLRGTEGWLKTGGITRLERWQDDLLAAVRRQPGVIAYPLELDLSDPDFRYVAVFEMTSSNLQSIAVRFLTEDSEVVRTVAPGWDSALYDWVTIELPPGVYGGLAIDLAPYANAQRLDARTGLMETLAGRVRVHAIDLFAIPASMVDQRARVARR